MGSYRGVAMSLALFTSGPGWRLATSLAKPHASHITAISKVTTCTVVPGRDISLAGGSYGNTLSKERRFSVCINKEESRVRNLMDSKHFSTSALRKGDDEGKDIASLAQKVDPKDAAAKKAAEEATKKALEKKKLADAKAAEKAKEKNAEAAKKAAEEKAAKEEAVKKAAAEKAAAEKAAAEKAAKKAAEEKAAKEEAAKKAAAEKAAAE